MKIAFSNAQCITSYLITFIFSIGSKIWSILKYVFFLWIFLSVCYGVIEHYNTLQQERIKTRQEKFEFLENKCKQIDIEYKILNNGKLLYRCPNGKEYKIQKTDN